jgi:sulfite exporter TauE/SafE
MLRLDLLGFFTLGFFGGFGHCIGMCHPFVLYISGRFVGSKRGYANLFLPHLLYNTGRTLTYGAMGGIAGLLGGMGEVAGGLVGIQKVSAIVAGAFLIIYAFFSFTGYNILNKLENTFANVKVMGYVKRVQPKHAFSTGLLLGSLPCGLVYSALIASTSTADPLKGLTAMLLFGAGTMTALMLTAVFGNLAMKKRGLFNILSLILLMGMGCYFIYSGITF